jgi:cell division protein FtsA
VKSVATIIGSDEAILVGIDIGTSKTCVLVGQLDMSQKIRIIGVGIVPSLGMKKGGVVDLDGLARAITAAKDKAERTSGYEITSAFISLSGTHVSSINSKGMAGVASRTISYDDVARSLEAARSVAVPFNRELVHVVPRGYVVDGQDGIKSAIGMYGYRLEVEAHIITANSTALRNLEKCLETAGVTVDGWVVSSLAASEVVLTDTEREMGVVVCDIGAGTCDVTIYIEGASWHTSVIPVGGDHMASDLAQGLHLPLETAEAIKRRHGHAEASRISPDQTIAVRPFGQERQVEIRLAEVAGILEPRVEEIYSLLRQEIKRSGYDGLLPAGIVLTGGASKLPGMPEVASRVLQLPVRCAKPDKLRGLTDKLDDPAFSASVGLLHWARLQTDQQYLEQRRFSLPAFDIQRAADFLKRLLPG